MDLAGLRQKVEQEIRAILDGGRYPLFGLDTMNAYHMGFSDREGKPVLASKGKYLRPIFCLAMCGGLGGDVDKALPAAASLEIIHRTSLIFDDIQDAGTERNGQPAVWTIWGQKQAINAGLALSCYARLAAQRGSQRGIPAETVLRILGVLENAVVSLCWGQYFDLSSMETLNVGVDDYLRMVRGKTAALFGAACESGAICAGADPATVEMAREFGITMGIAFQIHDDYLGIWGDEGQVGKTANDLSERKRSCPVVLALEKDHKMMSQWLTMIYTNPRQSETIKLWMTNMGIKDDVVRMRSDYINAAGKLVAALSLKKEWTGQFEQLISFLGERKL